MHRYRVLILGGTAEARQLSEVLADAQGYDVIVSLKGVTDVPRPQGGKLISGGFGGEQGLRSFLLDNRIDACVNATHPFAGTMSRNARQAAQAACIPFLRLKRRPWGRRSGDLWVEVSSLDEAAAEIGPGETVFLALGAQGSQTFAGHSGTRFVVRTIDPVPAAKRWPNATYLTGSPAPAPGEEVNLLKSCGVTTLVARNSGGDQGYSKIAAARMLGLRVVIVIPPAESGPPAAPDAVTAVEWLERHRNR